MTETIAVHATGVTVTEADRLRQDLRALRAGLAERIRLSIDERPCEDLGVTPKKVGSNRPVGYVTVTSADYKAGCKVASICAKHFDTIHNQSHDVPAG